MRRFLVLLLLVPLMACGQSKTTPLVHALTAFRAGDRQDFLAAKAEAADDLKTAIQPGQDLCLMSMLDVRKYGAVSVIDKLDHDELFRLPDDARLIYALKVAGSDMPIQPGSFLAQAPLVQDITHPGPDEPTCEKGKMMAALQNAGADATTYNEARMGFMRDWMGDTKSKYGDGFDDHMRSAEMSLEGVGYTAPWPPKIDFME